MKQIKSLIILIIAALVMMDVTSYASSYTVSWVGNTSPTLAGYVGNCARSMWVATDGTVYTASMWDEKGRNIGIYKNGAVVGGMGGTKDAQGSAIGGDATSIFVAMQAPSGGQVGRYNRNSKARDLLFAVSSTTSGDAITGIAVLNGLVYISDYPGNRVRVFTTAGAFQRDISVTQPGAIAIENDGANFWVAQMSTGKLRRYSSTGAAGTVISMASTARPSALNITPQNELWVGDQGPDMNVKIYTGLTGTPVLSSSYGVIGGYLSTSGATKGQTGAKRFTRVVGLGQDSANNIYVLNNPWGGTFDLGRDGGTDIHCYIRSTGALSWTLQALNFEGVAAVDPGATANLYSGNIVYTGTGGGCYLANTIDPFTYPSDPRINKSSGSRGENFGMAASVGGHRVIVATGQSPDKLFTYYFNTANGYIAIPGQIFDGTVIRNGFQLEPTTGDVWESMDKTGAIQHYPLTGWAASGAPIWGSAISTPTPASIGRLNRLGYVPATDTMVLAGGNTDWTLIGNRVEVYNGWVAGNRTPNHVITLSRAQAKSMAVAGAYVFIGYFAVPNVDVFDLSTGSLVLTMTTGGSVTYTGNDTDSMYGITAYKKSNGQYTVTKDDYNCNKVVVYTFVP